MERSEHVVTQAATLLESQQQQIRDLKKLSAIQREQIELLLAALKSENTARTEAEMRLRILSDRLNAFAVASQEAKVATHLALDSLTALISP